MSENHRLPGSRRLTLVVAAVSIGLAWATVLADPPAPVERHDDGSVTRRAIGGQEPPSPLRHRPNELLVRFKQGVSRAAANELLDAVPAISRREFRSVADLHHLRVAPGASLRQAMAALRRSRAVAYVEPNYLLDAAAVPNDPGFSSQWSLLNTGQGGGTAGADIDAVPAWDLATGSADVVVAVIDTGLDYNHPDLAANLFRNSADCDADGVDDDGNGHVDDCHGIDAVNGDSDPMDDEGHGTHVAGTIGAVGNNALGVVGVSWQVALLPCKFLDANGEGDTAGAIACLDYVASMRDRGAFVVATNNSWSGGLHSQSLVDAIRAQQDRGILFVAAAGNAGADNDLVRSYPCAYEVPNIVCVAATDARDLRASYSNYGRTTVHLGAPGDAILSTLPGAQYGTSSGTSMAAPHVTGVAALLHAQAPTRDFRAVKNLLLSGGQAVPAMSNTLTGRRLSALGSLTCSGAQVRSRVRPSANVLAGVGAPVTLSALSIDCDSPGAGVHVVVSPGGEVVPLLDEGAEPDELADDGLFSATWRPLAAGTFTLTFPDGSVVSVEVDPHLKPGFPVKAWAGGGSYHGGPAIHTLVGSIDEDPELEILATGLASGPLYAWNADGTPVPGWPGADMGAAYPALGELSPQPGLEVFSAHYGADPDLLAREGSGLFLPGWPRSSANYVATPPTLADLTGDGLDEILTEEEDWRLHAYRANGTVLPGWPPAGFVGGQERHTPAVADLDGDGDLEVVTASGSTSPGVYLLAHHHDASPVSGFPVLFSGHVDTFPAIGDVDGDGQLEIVVAGRVGGGDGALVFSSSGLLERSLAAAGTVFYGTAPALADLDANGFPEIVLQTNTAVNVWRGDGTPLPGWPVAVGTTTWLQNAGPVVGDLDGDGQPEVVALSLRGGAAGSPGDVIVLNANGSLAFRKTVAGLDNGAVPAIADIDRDGRTDLVVSADYWSGTSGYYDKVWAFDFRGPGPYGLIEWGQFMGGPGHHGLYAPTAPIPPTVSIHDSGGPEGDSGPTSLTLAVTLSHPSPLPVAVDYATADGTARAGQDYDAASGTLVFDPGVVSLPIPVAVSGDGLFEEDESLTVALSGAVNATLADASGAGTIVNDDSPPSASIGPVTVDEGDCGSGPAELTVALSAPSGLTARVSYATLPGSATAGVDYTAATGELVFDPGVVSLTVPVTVLGDTAHEPDETFTVTLGAPQNATIGDGSAAGTILDDDPDPATGAEGVVWTRAAGVAVCGNDLAKTAGASWTNAGASSTRGIDGTGHVEFTVPPNPGYAMFGLGQGDTDQGYPDVDYAFYTYPPTGRLMVYEKGVYRGQLGAYAEGDTLRISVDAGVVRYWLRGAVVHTSAQAPTFPLRVDTSLYSTGAVVRDATLAGSLVDLAFPTEAVTWQDAVGVSVAGATITKTAPTAWGNAGASSTRGIAPGGDGYAEFTLPASPGYAMFGLSQGDTDQSYADVDFAFYTYPPTARLMVYEKGVYRASAGAYAAGAQVRISVQSGVVQYWVQDALVYTSVEPPTFPLRVDASLYSSGAVVQDATLAGALVSVTLVPEAVSWQNAVGVSAAGATITKTAPAGWGNAGASSTRGIPSGSDGYAEFTLPASPGYAMFGLSQGDDNQGYADIDFAFYTYPPTGRLMIYEKGVYRGQVGTYAAGDKLRVSVGSGGVKYWFKGTLVYTSGQAPGFPLRIDTSLYSPGATVQDATLAGELAP